MSIRPVDFNGMIQNVQVAVMHEEQNASSMVQQMEKSQQHEYNYEDGEGNGRGYDAKGRKRARKKKHMDSDGVVRIKTGQPSFDIKI